MQKIAIVTKQKTLQIGQKFFAIEETVPTSLQYSFQLCIQDLRLVEIKQE